MLTKYKYKNVGIPKQWFFFNPTIKSNHKTFHKISNKTGIIFFQQKKNKLNVFLKSLLPYIRECKQKKIKFIIPCSLYWANKYNPFGVFLDNKFKEINNHLNINILKKKFFLATKIHNINEALRAKKYFDLIFISPAFITKSHPDQKPLSNYIFISLCFFFKEKVLFALGGVNKKKFQGKKNKKLHGFGAIHYFKEKK